MQTRVQWLMATVAATAVVVAVGVSLNGMLNASPAKAPQNDPAASSGNPQDLDPLAPRLFDQSGAIRIHVAGAVRKPGVYTMPSWTRVVDAMKKAGGPTPEADLDRINLADSVKDGEQVRIPTQGRAAPLNAHFPATEPPEVSPAVGGRGAGRYPFTPAGAHSPVAEASVLPPGGTPLNLNQATAQELEALPGIGPLTAANIVRYRQEHGSFLRPEDVMNVPGIGASRFDKMRPLVTAP